MGAALICRLGPDLGHCIVGLRSIEQVVICDEIIGYTRHFMRELEISDETLALDLIDQVGPDGDFMGSPHTRKHFREDWYPQLFERRNYDGWLKAGGKTLRERAREKALGILERHQPEPLDQEIQSQIDRIAARAHASVPSISG